MMLMMVTLTALVSTMLRTTQGFSSVHGTGIGRSGVPLTKALLSTNQRMSVQLSESPDVAKNDSPVEAPTNAESSEAEKVPLHRSEGIFAVYKPLDWTSNDVVSYIRGMLSRDARERGANPGRVGGSRRKRSRKSKNTIKVGHGGTLDPLATGVLVVGVGRGTKELQRYVELLCGSNITMWRLSTHTISLPLTLFPLCCVGVSFKI